jgi:hypothetical protein
VRHRRAITNQKWKEAAKVSCRILKLCPNASNYQLYAFDLERNHDYDEALKQLTLGLKLDVHDHDCNAPLMLAKARVLTCLGVFCSFFFLQFTLFFDAFFLFR